MATAQLQLSTADTGWKLDRRTIEIGRAGLAQAREALDKAIPTPPVADAEVSPFMAASTDTGSRARKARKQNTRRVSEGQGSLALFDSKTALAA